MARKTTTSKSAAAREDVGSLVFTEVAKIARAFGYRIDITWFALGSEALLLFGQRLVDGYYPARAGQPDPVRDVFADMEIQAELVAATAEASRPLQPARER